MRDKKLQSNHRNHRPIKNALFEESRSHYKEEWGIAEENHDCETSHGVCDVELKSCIQEWIFQELGGLPCYDH